MFIFATNKYSLKIRAMKTLHYFCLFITLSLVILGTSILFYSCKDEEPQIDITYGTMYDIEGNSYKTIKINNTEWMAENLKTTKYSSNSPISNPGTDTNSWRENTDGAYSVYDNNINHKASYGLLYNAFAVQSASGLCPTGWRIPTKEDFETLIALFGDLANAGGKLKSTRTDPAPHPRWDLPNTLLDEPIGYDALPAGIRYPNGEYNYLGSRCSFWSATPNYPYNDGAYFFSLHFDNTIVGVATTIRNAGFSVRCVKDH